MMVDKGVGVLITALNFCQARIVALPAIGAKHEFVEMMDEIGIGTECFVRKFSVGVLRNQVRRNGSELLEGPVAPKEFMLKGHAEILIG
jgi:hypothetical protein